MTRVINQRGLEISTSSTAQGGGGTFKNRKPKPIGRLVVVQIDPTDGPKVIVIFGVVAVVTSPTTAGCSVV